MTNLPAVPKDGGFARLAKAKSDADKAKALEMMGQYVTNEHFKEPVPAFLTELPFGGDDDETTDRIALNLFAADDPDDVGGPGESLNAMKLVGHDVVVWDIRVKPGSKGGGWKAYLLMDVTVDGSDLHQLANTGAKQVVARLARAWAEGLLPLKGRVVQINMGAGSENTPLAFITEPPLA
jgi:hypothetical protein